MNATADRLGAAAGQNRKVAALLCGRSFARFVFYLSQLALVNRVSPAGYAPDDSPNQWQLAFAELEELHRRCLEIEGYHTEGRHAIRDCMKRPLVSNEADMEELLRLFEELGRDESENSDKLRQNIVEIIVGPRQERLRLDIQNTFHGEVHWFELGRTLEEGLSRPDIYLFQLPFLNARPQVLRSDYYSTRQLAIVTGSTKFEENTNTDVMDDLLEVTHVTREPGDLIPHELWWAAVRHYWSVTGLSQGALRCMTELEQYQGPRKHMKTLLTECVEKLSVQACSIASGSLGRLNVDVAGSTVEVDGIPYDVSPQVAYLFLSLKLAGGTESFAAVKRQHPRVFGAHDKLKDLKRHMPKRLAALLRSRTGTKVKLDLGTEKTQL